MISPRKPSSLLKRVRLIVLILAALVIVAGAGGAFYLHSLFGRDAPLYAGREEIPNLSAGVRVYRDQHGVPHIFAATLPDAMRALGYLHADERLFQMEMNRRAGAGRLSEILGSSMLDVDTYTRTMGFYRLAAASFSALSPEAQAIETAYAEGVNRWLQTHEKRLPPEFTILNIKPEPWVPADSLVWGKLMALQLSGHYKLDAARGRLAEKLSPALMKALFPPPLGTAPITTMPRLASAVPAAPVLRPAVQQAPSAPKTVPQHSLPPAAPPAKQKRGDADSVSPPDALEKLGAITGLAHAASNEWVIGGARTESGKPILANDPHLGLEAPILWYLARIVTPEFSLTGATVPGVPAVILGHNDHIAWGFTTTGNDVQDLFIETVDPESADRYRTPDGAVPFETREEIIRVKGGMDVKLRVRSTRHGPVLSDIDEKLAAQAGAGKVMALAFTALGERDTTPEALMRLNRATNWGEFLAALQLYQAPTQNIAYADIAGNIGYISPGIVPVRKKGRGDVPVDGASGDYDWIGAVPFPHLPQIYNPPAGFIFNANNAVVGPGSAYYHGNDWEEPYRALRLQEFFERTAKHSPQTSVAMQMDHVSLAARELLPFLSRLKPADEREAAALKLLAAWDGTMDRDRAAPLIFDAWLRELHALMITEKIGDPLKDAGPFNAMVLAGMLGEYQAAWCAAPEKGAKPCGAETGEALRRALRFIRARHGDDMEKWRWGDEHRATLKHKFYSHLPVLRDRTELSAPSSGDFYTLDRGGGSEDENNPFARTHGGGFRGVYDLSDLSASRFIIASGQSGHIFAAHYRELFPLWNEGQSITIAGSEEDLAARNASLLEFVPGR